MRALKFISHLETSYALCWLRLALAFRDNECNNVLFQDWINVAPSHIWPRIFCYNMFNSSIMSLLDTVPAHYQLLKGLYWKAFGTSNHN